MNETYVITSWSILVGFAKFILLLTGQYNLKIFCHSPEHETQTENKSGSVQNSNCTSVIQNCVLQDTYLS